MHQGMYYWPQLVSNQVTIFNQATIAQELLRRQLLEIQQLGASTDEGNIYGQLHSFLRTNFIRTGKIKLPENLEQIKSNPRLKWKCSEKNIYHK